MIKFPPLADNERRVPSYNLPRLSEKLAKLERRAEKLGVSLPVYKMIRTEDLPIFDDETRIPTGEIAQFHVFTAESSAVHLPGWTLAAVVQHTTEGNILRQVPGVGVTLPGAYRTDSATCDHCGLRRPRTETFVLLHEDGQLTRVGRVCLKDFLGHTSAAQMIIALAGLVEALDGAFTEEEFEGGGYGVPRFYPSRVLTLTVAAIATFGWLSRSAARQGDRVATADTVLAHLYGFKPRLPSTEEHAAEAAAALEWARSLDPETESDYLHNCRVTALLGSWSAHEIGIGCSIVAAYQREQSRLNLMAFAKRLPSVHIGAEGQRFGGKGAKALPPLSVVVLRTHAMEGAYGLTTIVAMQTEVSESTVADLVWFASGHVEVKPGDRAILTGTIKRHDEREGRKQTHLTRCSLSVEA